MEQQFLKITQESNLVSITKIAGKHNVDEILTANQLPRTRAVGKSFYDMCKNIEQTSPDATAKEKANILNTFTSDGDVFEAASLLGESGWRVLKKLNTLPGYLRIPETIVLPDSTDILGGKKQPISQLIYTKVMNGLRYSPVIDSEIFNEYSSTASTNVGRAGNISAHSGTDMFSGFHIPWGRVQLYSSLADEVIDFPVYPEEVNQERQANYVTMPDIIYQYEPWYLFESSGPRTQEYTFHFHRDMWSGNHMDGKANQLIRFCEANCFPRYSGSAVYSPTVRMYINGATHVSGILTRVGTQWSGPFGHDGWYLECTLTLSITEISDIALNYDSVRSMGLIGGQLT